MKKRISLIIIIIILCLLSQNVFAISNVNIGRELTNEEYNALNSFGLKDYLIENMSEDDFNYYSVQLLKKQAIEVKYYKEIEAPAFPIQNGPRYINIEISEEEYNMANEDEFRGTVHETSYKRLEIILSQLSSSMNNEILVLTYLNWKKVPSTKSHDVFALYATNGKLLNNYSASQRMKELAPDEQDNCRLNNYIYHTTNYGSNNNGWNIVPYNPIAPLLGSLGEGISMKLNTTVSQCLYDAGTVFGEIKGYEFSLISRAVAGDNGHATIRASYQHAQSSVSFNDSKVYTYSTSGYGGVINFTNPITASKYDQMGGVSATI